MDKNHVFDKVREVSSTVKEGGAGLENIINKTVLSLDENLNFSFPIDETTVKVYEEIANGLDVSSRRTTLKDEIKNDDEFGTGKGSLISSLDALESTLGTNKSEMETAQSSIPSDKKNVDYAIKYKDYSNKKNKFEHTEQKFNELKDEIKKKQTIYKALEKFDTGLYSGAVETRKREIEELKLMRGVFDVGKTIDHVTRPIGGSLTAVDLNTAYFNGVGATVGAMSVSGTAAKEYSFYDEKQKKIIRLGDPLTVSATTLSGNQIQVTLKGIAITGGNILSITDLQVEGDTNDAPLQIRDLYIRSMYQHTSGRTFYHDKKFSLTINKPLATFDIGLKYDAINSPVSGGGNRIGNQLKHVWDRKYDDIRKDVVFSLLEKNTKSQFDKLSKEQKDAFVARAMLGLDMSDAEFRTAFKDIIVSDSASFKGTETEFEEQLLQNLDSKVEEKLKKILENRLDNTVGTPAQRVRSTIIGDFTRYFIDVDIHKDNARREALYDSINTRMGGQITTQLSIVHNNKYKDVKKEILLKLMEDTNSESFKKLTDKQKDAFVAGLATAGYDMNAADFQFAFKDEVTKENFSGTEEEFEKQLLTNFDSKAEEKLKKILEDRLDSSQIGGQKSRSVIIGHILDFLNNTEMNLATRYTTLGIIESNLDATYLQTRLRQEFENKFNKVQREAFEKTLSSNPEFAKLNQAQKDRLYERMQAIGTIPTGPINVKLGNNIPPATGTLEYPISDLLFSPSIHYYTIMPHREDYNGFKLWLANQAPKDVLNDADKYRERLRNGLVASLDNGKTHYENFFADVVKKFTDNVNVKTTLNKVLLDFINDTNEADHMAFDAALLANLTSTTPLTDHPKKRYQKLAFWKQGEAQNYLSFFKGQSEEFKTESITVGGKTISYSGKLNIGGAEEVSMSLKMKDQQEQIYTSGSPISLIRSLLRSPDIEPPHARFHAGLSVIKSVTKLARANGLSLRSHLTPAMLDTLPVSIRTTLQAGENPMVEIEESNGKLVAKVFNLNLTTRRKENEYKMFDEQDFVATQSVRDLRQGVESLLSLTNHVLNDTYKGYRQANRGSGLRRALLKKYRYGGLANLWKTISFEGQSISVGGKNVTLDCKNGLFTFSGEGIEKPISGKNLGSLLTYNPALRGIELKALHVANEKMIETYQEKLTQKNRLKNYGVIDELNHRVYILDKHGNLGYIDNTSQAFTQRWRQYTSGCSYGRIKDGDMPTGFRVMKRGKDVVDKENYENFLRNESLVGPMVRAMSRTHRAITTWAPWD